MLQKIFTIHDIKASAYLPPFFMPQTGMALRVFGDCINDQEHQFSNHPEDYTLFALGTFDDQTAIAITTPPESLGNGLEFIVKEGDENQTEMFKVPKKLNSKKGKQL